MKRFIRKKRKILNTIIFTLIYIIIIAFYFHNNYVYNVLIVVLALVFYMLIELLITIIMNFNLINKEYEFLNTCNPDYLIKYLENEIDDYDNKDLEDLKLKLCQTIIYKNGINKKTINIFEEINIKYLSSYCIKDYKKIELIIKLNQNKLDEARKILNFNEIKKDKKLYKLLKEIIILFSNETKDQEEYFLNYLKLCKKDNLYSNLNALYLLGKYYLKIKEYNKAQECFLEIVKLSNNTYICNNSKEILKQIKRKKTNLLKEYLEIPCEFRNYAKNLKIFLYLSIVVLIIILMVFITLLVKDSTPIKAADFNNYFYNSKCQTIKDNTVIDGIKSHYVTDSACNYKIGFIEIDSNEEQIYNKVVKEINKNNGVIIERGVTYKLNYVEKYFVGDFYTIAIKKGKTIIYAIVTEEYEKEMSKIFNRLNYKSAYFRKRIM